MMRPASFAPLFDLVAMWFLFDYKGLNSLMQSAGSHATFYNRHTSISSGQVLTLANNSVDFKSH